MADIKKNQYWDLLIEERVINLMKAKKFQELTLKCKCNLIKDIIQQIECNKQQAQARVTNNRHTL